MTDAPGAPAGWYADSEVPGGMRYWDGAAWTAHRRPPPPVAGATVPPAPRRRLGRGATIAIGAVTAVVIVGVIGSVAGVNTSSAPPVAASSTPSVPSTASATPAPTSTRTAAATAPDPEANPTSTARVSTVGLKPAAVLPGARKACRSGNPLANVYHPYRLQVVATCSTVAGVVESVRHEDDGDVHIDLAVDGAYRQMLDAGNRTYQHGWLVLELVPADQPGCVVGRPPRPATGTYDYGICTGADEATPRVGEHIWVTGPYVIDHWHGWTEIHPVWSITTTRPAASITLVRTSPTSAQAATQTAHVTCSASMTDATPARYSTTTVVVRASPGAAVSATAHYRSTSTTHSATAGGSGVAQLPFRISGATLGYQVDVTVTATTAAGRATCSTSFTPTA